MILNLLAEFGINPKKVSSTKGGEYHSPCPRCGGTDRFHAWPEQYEGQGSFWCRNCDIGGDCIKFLMEYSDLSFRQAAERTGKKLEEQSRSGYTTPRPPQQKQQRQSKSRECVLPADIWQQAAGDLLLKGQEQLLDNPEQLAYLAGRGLPIEAVKRYGLGWIGSAEKNCIFSSRKKWGLPRKESNKKPNALWIPRGILIPNIIDSRVDSLRIRRPKRDRIPPLEDLSYHVIPGGGTASHLYHSDQPAVVVVEAQLDGLLCHHVAGDIIGVLALGNSSSRPDERSMAVLQQSKLILVALDFDDNNAGGHAWNRWKADFDQAKRWPVPEGKDPGEAYAAGVDIRQWLQAGLPDVWRDSKDKRTQEESLDTELSVIPGHAKGVTKNGYDYVVAYQAEHVEQLQQRYPDAVVFSPKEIKALKGMDPLDAEKMLLAKKEFGGQIVETRPVEPGQYHDFVPFPDVPEMVQDSMSYERRQ